MTHSPSNLPPDEATLLDYIEGDLTPEAARRVELSLKPAELARMRAIRGDAAEIRNLGDLRAPAGLLAGVADALERDMLLGVREDGELLSDSLPISRIETRVRRRSFVGARRLALAAGFVLLVGGAAFVGYSMLKPPVSSMTHSEERPLALNSGPSVSNPVDQPGATGDLALAEQGDNPAAIESSSRGTPSSGTPVAQAPPTPLTLDEAVALLEQGRLVIRVRCAAPEPIVDFLAKVDERSADIRLSDQVPVELAAAVLEAAPSRGGHDESPAPFVFAGDEPPPGQIDIEWEIPGFTPVAFDPRIVLLEMNADNRTLAAAVRRLTQQTGHEVVLEAVEGALALPPARPSAETLLWWTRPAYEWTPRAVVPVVIEPLR